MTGPSGQWGARAERIARREALEARLKALFGAAGYGAAEVDILQPAELYLERAGEDIRSRMFFFDDDGSGEMCLRADLTLPLAALLIAEPRAMPVRLFSIGPTFRAARRGPGPREAHQAGIENFGAGDPWAADLEVLALTLEAARAAAPGPLAVTLGDISLFSALVEGLALHPRRARRLAHAFRHPALLEKVLAGSGAGGPLPEGMPREGGAEAYVAFVAETLRTQKIELTGGRSVEEIAAHLMERAADAEAAPLSGAVIAAIRGYLAAAGDPRATLPAIAAIDPSPVYRAATEGLAERVRAVTPLLRPGDRLEISSVLGRRFLYYTGFVFEVSVPGAALPLGAGGRYDTLFEDLGAGVPVRAVGAALTLERLLAAGGTP